MASGRNFTSGSEIVVDDFNALNSAIERQIFGRLAYYFASKKSNGFFADSFSVAYTNGTTIILKAGLGIQTDLTQVAPESTIRQVYLPSDTQLSLTPADVAKPRIDLICVRGDTVTSINGSRNFKDLSSGTVTAQNVVLEKDWLATIQVVSGVAATSPVAPAVPTGFIQVASLLMSANVGLANQAAITDSRLVFALGPYSSMVTTGFGRLTASATTLFSQLFSDTDTLLKYGRPYYLDFDTLDTSASIADPGAPAASRMRVYARDGALYARNAGGGKVSLTTETIIFLNQTTADANQTITANDNGKTYLVNSAVSGMVFQLPANPQAGMRFKVVDIGGALGANQNFAFAPPDGVTKIQGLAQIYNARAAWGSWNIVSDGTNWFFI